MNTALPYRPPTDGWKSNTEVGGHFQHWRSALANTPVYENLTRVFNWLCGGEDGWVGSIPPYTRYDSAGAAEEAINPNCATVLVDGGQVFPGDADWCSTPPHKPPCGEWNRREFTKACASGNIRFGDNCYSPTALSGVTVNRAECQSAGHRGAQARKSWHGTFSYMDPDRGGCDVTVGDPITGTPSGTKYTTVRFQVSSHHTTTYNSTVTGPATDDIWVVDHVYTLDQTLKIDTRTGVIRIDPVPACSYSDTWTVHHTYTDESGFHDNELVESGVPGMDCEHDFAGGWWTYAALFMDLNCDGVLSSASHYTENDPGGWGGGWTPGQGAIMPSGTAAEFLADVQNEKFPALVEDVYYIPWNGVYPYNQTGVGTLEDPMINVINIDESPWRFDTFPSLLEGQTYSGRRHTERSATTGTVTTENTGFAMEFANSGSGYFQGSHGYSDGDKPGAGNYDYAFTNEFSCSYELDPEDTYSASTVESEVKAMLAYWDLSDDSYNIWRQDGWTTVYPLLSYDEVPYGVALPLTPIVNTDSPDHDPPGGYPLCDWVDPYEGRYRGSILGLPVNIAGNNVTTVFQGTTQASRAGAGTCGGCQYVVDSSGQFWWGVDGMTILSVIKWSKASGEDRTIVCAGAVSDVDYRSFDAPYGPASPGGGVAVVTNASLYTTGTEVLEITYRHWEPYGTETVWPQTRLAAEPVMDLCAAAAGETTLPLQLPPDGTLVVRRFAADGTVQFTGALVTDYTYDATTRIVTVLGTAAPEGYPTQTLAKVTDGDYIRADYAVTQAIGGHFDWRHFTPRFWLDEVNYTPPVYLRDYGARGAYSGGTYGLDPTDAVQPWNATQWTGGDPVNYASDGRFLPHGAFILWRQTSEDCWMQKTAEVKMPWRSQNWFGPCGSDRDVMQDQTCADNETAQCLHVYGREGVSIPPSNPMIVGFPLNTNNRILAWAWSTPPSDPVPTPPELDPNCPFLAIERWEVGGVTPLATGVLGVDYTVGSIVPGLDPLYWYADIIPGGNLFPADESGNTCKRTGGTHAWPYAWPIEGDRLVTLVQGTGADTGKVIATMDRQAEYLRVGDLVSFTKDWATGLTTSAIICDDNSGAGWPVTDVDVEAKTFKFTATLTSLTNYAAITRVRSVVDAGAGPVNAPGYWWYDTDGKGEFLAVTHRTNNRDIAITPTLRAAQVGDGMPQNVDEYTVTQGALTFNRCYPSVMCYSPNYDANDAATIDKFEHGITYGFGTPTRDTRFGATWHGVFIQAVTDLWYIAPQPPCVADSFLEDDPTCAPTECTWTEDDGTGSQADLCFEGLGELSGIRVYPHHPLVEPRSDVPTAWISGDTPPSSDRHLDAHYPTLAEMTGALTNGTIVVPPVNAGPSTVQSILDTPSVVWSTYNAAFAQWGYWLNMQDCICNRRRWWDNGVIADVPDYRYRGYRYILGTGMCPCVQDISKDGTPIDTDSRYIDE